MVNIYRTHVIIDDTLFALLPSKSYTLLIAVCDMCTAITINAKMENGGYWRYRRKGWLLWHWTRKEKVFTGRLKKAHILYVQSNY